MNQILLNGIDVDELLSKIEKLLDAKLTTKQTQETNPVYLSRIEVAKLLKITLPTLHDWTKLGWLQSYKIGHRILYKPKEVEESVKSLSSTKHKKF